jgi:hypothetical protein
MRRTVGAAEEEIVIVVAVALPAALDLLRRPMILQDGEGNVIEPDRAPAGL